MKIFIKSFAIISIIFFGFFLFIFTHPISGWRAYVVTSGSMEPVIPTGALVITKKVPPKSLSTNDIITFIKPEKGREYITHRIVNIDTKNPIPLILTKGDNNATHDRWALVGGSVVGKVAYTIPFIGYVFAFSKTKIGIILFILIPAFYVFYSEISVILSLLKSSKNNIHNIPSAHNALLVILVGSMQYYIVFPSSALMADSAKLTGNNFNVAQQETHTECPEDDEDVIIENNGIGSKTQIDISSICIVKFNQSNNTIINNSISSTISSGGNQNNFSSLYTETKSDSANISLSDTEESVKGRR